MNQVKFNISQSIMKAFAEYKLGKSCGLLFKAQYIDRVKTPPSEAMQLGNYFEQMCFDIPERTPVLTGKGELTADSKRAVIQAETFKKTLYQNCWNLISAGKYYKKDGNSMLVDAEIDEGTGETTILDTKFSGLINDDWSGFGWGMALVREGVAKATTAKEGIFLQPIHYKWLWREIHGVIPEFLWYIASSKNELEAKIIRANVPEWRIDVHGEHIENVRRHINLELDRGLVARPEMKRCSECPLRETCDRFTAIPNIEEIEINF